MLFEFKPQKSRGKKHYRIKSDQYNLILCELKKVKNRDTDDWKVDEDGNIVLKEYIVGYFRNPIDMVERLVEHDVMNADDDAIEDFPDLIKAWGELTEELRELLKGVK